MKIEKLDKLRDCVKDAYLDGCSRGDEFQKMRHAIISELKRLGYDSSQTKDALLEWDKRCERPLSLSEQKIQLLKYVDWFEKHECRTGCRTLEDYCIGKNNCQFYKRSTHQRRQETPDLPFDIKKLEKFLNVRFKSNGRIMFLIVKALRGVQIEKATGEVIFIGVRSISSIIRDTEGHRLDPMDIFRNMNLLIDEKIIEKTVKGKAGHFTHQANGYKFLKWEPP